MAFWTAFTIGLFGSLHCVGMCGPIAMALPYQDRNRWLTLGNTLLYNLGRVVTYALLGGVIGLVGKGLFLAGAQQTISIVLGVSLLVIALFSINLEFQLLKIPAWQRWNAWLKQQLGFFLRKNTRSSLFVVGMLNGLLPCGLVYMAIAGAVTTFSPAGGMLYMALFGLGTIPLMLTAALAGNFASVKLRSHLRKVLPVILVGFAVLLILRGLNFDLPLDIQFWLEDPTMCHE